MCGVSPDADGEKEEQELYAFIKSAMKLTEYQIAVLGEIRQQLELLVDSMRNRDQKGYQTKLTGIAQEIKKIEKEVCE